MGPRGVNRSSLALTSSSPGFPGAMDGLTMLAVTHTETGAHLDCTLLTPLLQF